jgi:cytochrome c551/c552
MPATERTCYDLKLLHKVFAVASLGLLAATLWLLIDDHRREWKIFQRAANQVDLKLTDWRRLEVASDAAGDAERQRLETAIVERRSTYFTFKFGFPLPGKKILELPILEAFNSPLKIETLWCEGLTQDYNFREVRRFDRCTTCHQRTTKTRLGSGNDAAFADEEMLTFVLRPTPKPQTAAADTAVSGNTRPATWIVAEVFGLTLDAEGLLDEHAVTVSSVREGSAAARAEPLGEMVQPLSGEALVTGLMVAAPAPRRDAVPAGLLVGDVLTEIDGEPVTGPQRLLARLLDAASEAVRLQAEGKAGDIKPLTLQIRRGLPQPYVSHPRLDLYLGAASPHKLADFACTICHEGQGSATEFRWASHSPNSQAQRADWRDKYGWFDNGHWKYPMLPQRFLESVCLKCHHGVTEIAAGGRFLEPPAPKVLRGYRLIRIHGCFGCHEIGGYEGGRSVGPDLRLEPMTDTDKPGTLRKVGPSLRHVAHKLDTAFLHDWLQNPKHFRPTTRMPSGFGLWHHLDPQGRQAAQDYEPLEAQGLATFLTERSQEFDATGSGVSSGQRDNPAKKHFVENDSRPPIADAACGKILFQARGCLACHEHRDFPEAAAFRDPQDIVSGPDLSAMGDKFRSDKGRQWLYGWLKEPTRYNPRTLMPSLGLDPIEHKDSTSQVMSVTDPVADLIEYLVQHGRGGYTPEPLPPANPLKLTALVAEHLRSSFPESQAQIYAQRGIPERLRATLQRPDTELLVADREFANPQFRLGDAQKLMYVGHRSVLKSGCHGCHDIPGFEDAKPIGPSLTGFGRMNAERLAFERVATYLQLPAASAHGLDATFQPPGDPPRPREWPDDFYLRQILYGTRIGFIYQKLTEPRSFDYDVALRKRYHERLRMPQFPFSLEDREAIMTFVLGLVAHPPSEQYVYRPDARRATVLRGQQVWEKYSCGSCHVLQPEQWRIRFPPGTFTAQRRQPTYPFAEARLAPDATPVSMLTDRSGRLHATLAGAPVLDDRGRPAVFDQDGDQLAGDESYDPASVEYAFQLWQPAALEGHAYRVGESPLNIPAQWVVERRPGRGGFLTRYLLPHVAKLEKAANPKAKGAEAWGWVPPPLLGEGAKVQPDWLRDYLLNPVPIRPAAFLRMPRFNLSEQEATQLVDYFATFDEGVGSAFRPTIQPESTALDRRRLPAPSFAQAMRIVTDKNYCVTCHQIADFDPQTSDRAKAPDLARVYRRLRTGYVRRWLAKPASILPYTPMPINIPYDPAKDHLGGADQTLYPGTSVEQLDALVDLLMHWDQYAQARSPVAPLVKPPPTATRAAKTDRSSGEEDSR